MKNNIVKSLWLLGSSVVICCLIYPLAVWAIGQTFFPFTANGSMVNGPDGKPVGSLLIAQPFTKDEYFQPRPSAASYDGSASDFIRTVCLQLYVALSRSTATRSYRQVQERTKGGSVGGARHRSLVPAGQLRWTAAYRRAVGGCSQRSGTGMGKCRSDARQVHYRLGCEAHKAEVAD